MVGSRDEEAAYIEEEKKKNGRLNAEVLRTKMAKHEARVGK